MDITFTCPACDEVSLIGQEFVGQSGPCRTCDKLVMVQISTEKPPPIVIKEERHSAPQRTSSGFFWKAALVVVVLLVVWCTLLLPAVTFPRDAVRRMSSANNLKQIALAMHNYHSVYRQFPRAYWLTADGKRTLSWRIAIQPFAVDNEFLENYDSSEPWDGEANQFLLIKRFSLFQFPGIEEKQSMDTAYVVITGPGTMFEEGVECRFEDIKDGASNTIMAVEVKNSGVHWLEPRDLDIRTMIMRINGGDGNSISSPWNNGANVAMADGSVQFLTNSTLESTLRAMITRSGGEQFEMPK